MKLQLTVILLVVALGVVLAQRGGGGRGGGGRGGGGRDGSGESRGPPKCKPKKPSPFIKMLLKQKTISELDADDVTSALGSCLEFNYMMHIKLASKYTIMKTMRENKKAAMTAAVGIAFANLPVTDSGCLETVEQAVDFLNNTLKPELQGIKEQFKEDLEAYAQSIGVELDEPAPEDDCKMEPTEEMKQKFEDMLSSKLPICFSGAEDVLEFMKNLKRKPKKDESDSESESEEERSEKKAEMVQKVEEAVDRLGVGNYTGECVTNCYLKLLIKDIFHKAMMGPPRREPRQHGGHHKGKKDKGPRGPPPCMRDGVDLYWSERADTDCNSFENAEDLKSYITDMSDYVEKYCEDNKPTQEKRQNQGPQESMYDGSDPEPNEMDMRKIAEALIDNYLADEVTVPITYTAQEFADLIKAIAAHIEANKPSENAAASKRRLLERLLKVLEESK